MQFVHLVPEICCEMLNVSFLPPDGSIEWLSASWMLVARWKEAGRCKLQDFSSAMKRVSCKLYIQLSSQTLSVIRWEQTCPVPDAGCKMLAARKLSSLHHQCIRRAVVVEQWQVNYSARGSYTPSLIIGEQKKIRGNLDFTGCRELHQLGILKVGVLFFCHKLSELLVVTRNLDRAMETYLKI